jgi:hypothetical protein
MSAVVGVLALGRFPSPQPGRGPSGMALSFNCCNGLAGGSGACALPRGEVRRPACPRTRPAHKRGWAGAGRVQPGLAARAQSSKFKLLSPSAGRCAFRPPPPHPTPPPFGGLGAAKCDEMAYMAYGSAHGQNVHVPRRPQ